MNIRTNTIRSAALVAALTVSVASAWAGNPKEEESLRKMQFNLDKNGLAIEGYDPVAYFPEGGEKPAKGSPDYQATRLGVTYWFVNDENRQRFLADPEKYEPAYGGWCAYAMGAKGAKVEVDPKAYEVRDGHLFLFYRSILTDTRKPWGKNRDTLKPAADKNWEQVIHDPADKAKKGK